MAGDSIILHVLATAGIHAVERLRRARFLRYKLIRPNADVRISFSTLLRISDGGRYLLLRNMRRQELFGPFGGVCKFAESCRPYLDEILFRPQDVGPGRIMGNDLRGFLPRKNLANFIKWYYSMSQRESPAECLCRELTEEVREIHPSVSLTIPKSLDVKRIRVVEEGPEIVPSANYLQFRIFELYEVASHSHESLTLFGTLIKLGEYHKDLLLANAHELRTGRSSDGRLIGHYAVYLVGTKRFRPDQPAFVGSIP